MAANWPGHLSYDSVIQLLEGRTGDYSGWHPPVMSWLLGLADAVGPGVALFVLGNATLFFATLASLPWLPAKPSWLAIPAALACAALPQIFLYQAIVWKDVLFANAAVAGFLFLAHIAVRWRHRGARCLLLGTSLLCLSLAALARQNGIVLVPFAGLALGWIAWRRGASGAAAGIAGTLFALAIIAGWLSGSVALATRIVGDRGQAKQVRLLEFYDLNGALAADAALRLPDLQRRDPALLAIMRSDGRNLYSPARSDFLARSARLQAALAGAPDDILHRSWMDYLRRRPLLYLENRAEEFRWVFLTPDMSLCVPYVVGLRGPPQVLNALGMKERVTARDKTIKAYAAALVGTPVFSHLTFLLLTLAELAFLFWRRRAADIALIGLLMGALAFASSFFFVSIACDYRYLYLLDLAALVALFYIALDPQVGDSRCPRCTGPGRCFSRALWQSV